MTESNEVKYWTDQFVDVNNMFITQEQLDTSVLSRRWLGKREKLYAELFREIVNYEYK